MERKMTMGKKSKRKTHTLKKPVFQTILLKKLLITTIVATMFLMIVGRVAGYFYTLNMKDLLILESVNFSAMVYDEFEIAEDKEAFEQALTYEISECYNAFSFINQETGEVVASLTEDAMFVAQYSTTFPYERTGLYICEDTEIVEAFRNATKETGYDEGKSYLQMLEYYFKDNTFIPGRIRFLSDDDEVLVELDFTPDNLDGYKINHVGNAAPSILSDSLPSEVRSGLEKAINARSDYMDKDIVLSDMDLWGNITCVSYKWLSLGAVANEDPFPIGTTPERKEHEGYYCAIGFSQCNFFEDWLDECIEVTFATVVVAFIYVIVSSWTIYTKQKNIYEMDQYRRNITNTMAHDLKSPLMVISGYAENLLEQDLPEKAQHFSKSIMENTTYMNQIIEKTLELSKVENGSYKLQKESVNLRAITNDIIENYTPQLEQKGLKIQIIGECELTADKIAMIQVLDNLIGNAMKYSLEGSVIEIQMKDNSYEISNVSVVDLDMDVRDLVKPFVKGDDSRSGKKGSGIGLTIVKNLCEQQGYELSVACTDGVFAAKIKF